MRTTTQITQALFAKEGENFAPVSLPHTWNGLDGQDGGGDYYRGTGIYKIRLPNPTLGKRQYIAFEAANHIATVFCNGKKLGSHEGGFSTFRFELTEAMKPCDNEVTVQVFNGLSHVYPQNADFTFCGGLYRSVYFIEVEQAHFDLMKLGSDAVFVTPHTGGNTRFDVFPVNAAGCSVVVEIRDAEDTGVASAVADAADHTVMHLKVEKPRLWHGLNDPYCYRAVACLYREEELLDQVEVLFGYRSFHVCPNTGFWLNGKNYPLHGVCRHQERKDKGWAISKADHDEDAQLIREVGANTIRLGHYQHDGYFYQLCDQLGFVVWAEIPFITKHIPGEAARRNSISQMTELIVQCYNHPSICFWGISNEITIGGNSEEQLENLMQLHGLCKRLDPNRLTTLAQLGGIPNDSDHAHITDVQSYNYYLGWYAGTVEDNGKRMDAWHAANPDKAYGISEYGADHHTCWHSADPFNHDYTEEYALWYHHEMLKTFSTRPFLWATHAWIMFDYASDSRDEGGFPGVNAKGLVNHDRTIKKDTFYLYQAYWTKKPMVHICGRRFADRAPNERNISVVTNAASVKLEVNGQPIGIQEVCDHMAIFCNVPLRGGINRITAVTDAAMDTVELNGVAEHNTAYDMPDVLEAVQTGNWFLSQKDLGEPTNLFDISIPCGSLLADEACLRIVKGWLMASNGIPAAHKIAICGQLTNYQAVWGDRTIPELPEIAKWMQQTDFSLLDRMLRKIPKLEDRQ